MNTQRAREILESPSEIDVLHNNTPVWIQNVDDDTNTARVFRANNPDDEITVSLDELNEQ